MMTNQLNNELDAVSIDPTDSNFYNVQNFRILRQNGFYGVTLPVMVRLYDTTAQTAVNYTAPFFIANRSYKVIQVIERHEAAGTDAGSVTLQLVKVPSGTAPGSGTNILSAGINLKATANTNQTITSLTSTKINQDTSSRLVSGDALSLSSSGTLTALKGVTVYVLLRAI